MRVRGGPRVVRNTHLLLHTYVLLLLLLLLLLGEKLIFSLAFLLISHCVFFYNDRYSI
jgi:hypothetical protein